MERDKELAKLVNVLRRTSRMALQSEWTGSSDDAARFCALQYNRVLARLEVIEPAVKPLFAPLPESASPQVIRMAAIELAAFFDDEAGGEQDERHEPRARRRHGCRPRVLVGVLTTGRC